LCRLQDEKASKEDNVEELNEVNIEEDKNIKEVDRSVSVANKEKEELKLKKYKADFWKENCEYSAALVFSIIVAVWSSDSGSVRYG
jgi:hypothetical protein